ncbi:sensor histidine kinase [Sphingomonas colocasiae]|uniref:histidine kinase n=1 Tax=Sphingomonas colocasiae TaxID=1848973 RepID=A0ABS7PSW1_9SPHN|nr:sensor histidine kinase [Sphingomonas colocasiae]MBY8824425.1 sensor histidine kinase [Sphingomonas colocasiae]
MNAALRNSLRFRLIVGSAILVTIAIMIAGLFIANLYQIHTTERFRSELDHHLEELVALIELGPDGGRQVRQPLSDPLFHFDGSGLYWQIDQAGHPPLRSRSLGRNLLIARPDDAAWADSTAGAEPVLQRTQVVNGPGGARLAVTIASARRLLEAQVDQFHPDLAWSMAILALLMIGGAAALVRFGLKPVHRLGDQVDQLRRGEIGRLDQRVPAEVEPVVVRLNQLLDGQAQLIARARTESGNLAHHLRTPLALIADEAEQLRLTGHEASADFLLARCDAMRRHIDYHLTRAAAAGTRGAGTMTEVAPLVGQIVAAMERLHLARAIEIRAEIAPGMMLACESGDLAEILSNLIDNGCKWARSRVTIQGEGTRIAVSDDGPGIPIERRADAVAVGVRLDSATPGTGLGLAATRDLLQFYDAALQLDAAPEGGLLAVISFRPAARQ